MDHKIWQSTLIASLAVLFVWVKSGTCADNANNVPIHVEADRMESFQKENAVLFSGNVEAKQGDLILHADEMTVYYLSSEEQEKLEPGENQKIKKLFAKGNVEIQNEGWMATGDAVEFFQTERKVRLTGNTKVWQGNNMVTGEVVVMYLDEGKSIVERSKKEGERVTAIIGPSGEKTDDKQQDDSKK